MSKRDPENSPEYSEFLYLCGNNHRTMHPLPLSNPPPHLSHSSQIFVNTNILIILRCLAFYSSNSNSLRACPCMPPTASASLKAPSGFTLLYPESPIRASGHVTEIITFILPYPCGTGQRRAQGPSAAEARLRAGTSAFRNLLLFSKRDPENS